MSAHEGSSWQEDMNRAPVNGPVLRSGPAHNGQPTVGMGSGQTPPARTIAVVAMELEAAVSDSVRLRAALEKERALRAELARLIAALPTGEVPFSGPLNWGTP